MSCEKIFVNQTALRLILDTQVDFDEYPVESSQIVVMNPKGLKSTWTATVLENDNGKIFVDFSNNIKFTLAGEHKARAVLNFLNGKVGIGDWVKFMVYA